MISQLAQKVGLDEDELKRIILFLVQIPISYLFYSIPLSKEPKKKQDEIFFRKLIGSILQIFFWLFLYTYTEILLTLCSLVLGYYVSQFSTTAKKNLQLNLLTFLWIFFAHVHKYSIHEEDVLDLSFILMLLVPRMCYFNNYMHKIFKHNIENDEDKMIRPSFFDYFVYTTNYIGNNFNPTFSYEEYKNFIEQTYRDKGLNVPNLVKKIIQLIISAIVFFFLSSRINFRYPFEENFRNIGIFRQYLFMFIISFGSRAKYYIGFLMGDIISILANMRSETSMYEKNIVSQNISKLELQFSPKVRVENWNISINQWLRASFYDLSQEAYNLKRTKASFLTFMISAFWHGVYPAYYVSFLMLSMVTQIEKFVYKNPNLHFMPQLVYIITFDLFFFMFKSFNNQRLMIYLNNVREWLVLFVILYFITRYFPKQKLKKKN